MTLNQKQKCLLDASGELSEAAREALLEEAKNNLQLQAEIEDARERFAVFGALPIPEPSAAERKSIPATIKRAVHGALIEHEKQATPPRRLGLVVRLAAGGLALAACAALVIGVFILHGKSAMRSLPVASVSNHVDPSSLVRPLVITTPSENEDNGMGSIAAMPEDMQDFGPDGNEPSPY